MKTYNLLILLHNMLTTGVGNVEYKISLTVKIFGGRSFFFREGPPGG
jgi:hypothetical protein